MKKKRWLIMPVIFLLGVVSAYMIVYSALEGAKIRERVEQMRGSIAKIDAFLIADHPNPYKNINAVTKAATTPAPKKEVGLYASYEAPEGYIIKSFSTKWNVEKLVALDEELKKNQHGEELKTLHEVRVLPKVGGTAVADHRTERIAVPFTLEHPVLPSDFCLNLTQDGSVITLYDGDARTTIASMARSLSHEYGHLFNQYYIFKTPEDYTTGRYVQLRDLSDKARTLILDRDDYHENHRWYIDEIAAEDYVLLMGSPTTRQKIEFADVRQLLAKGRTERRLDKHSIDAMNICPQENMAISLANDVYGLPEYFYDFLDKTPPSPAVTERPIDIQLQGYDVGYDLVGGYETFEYFKITWTTPYPEGAFYTLICCDEEDGIPIPIKTVSQGQKGSATIGTVTSERGNKVNVMSDSLDKGNKVFFVTTMLPDGTLYVSDPLAYSFD